LRKSSFPFGLFDVEDAKGYLNLTIHSIAKTESVPLLHFTTRKEGTDHMTHIVEKYHLCQKLCGLYPTQSACFHHSIKQCDGACIGEESPESYNERVSELVKQLSFEGKSFYILDKGRNKGERSMVWIENGAYKGSAEVILHTSIMINMIHDRSLK
jgi:DNA polymerase-3 subunit epsilon